MNRSMFVFLFIAVAIVTVSGCFPGGTMYNAQEPAGFFSGVWHGWIAPISLIIGFFKSDIRLYETTNTGWWYDFGFYIAVISGFGGVAFFRRKEKKGRG